ncbi:MAG: UDP-N-acetylmuramoyl-L-alanine--D-glutamate ligase, partial [Alphaproteobacteria bacterium]|nr:UDP-N-acetylmuramoyl-L-alanine--D-glutamate ligase [Alphaproteobacteria bacterium]
MIPVAGFYGKKVAVFGLGLSGLSACFALRCGGAEVLAGDDDPARESVAAAKG